MSLLGSITQKILFDVSAKTDKAEGEFKNLKREVDASANAIKRHGDASVGMFSKATDGFAKLGLSVDGIKKTFEIANKGLDAYAKTSKAAADEVAKVKKSTDEAFGAAQVAIGRTVVALGPLISALGSVVSKLAEITSFSAGGLEDVINLISAAGGNSAAAKKFFSKHGLTRDGQTGEMYVSDARDIYIRNATSGESSKPGFAFSNDIDRRLAEGKAGADYDRQIRENSASGARLTGYAGEAVSALNRAVGFASNAVGRLGASDPWGGKAGKRPAGARSSATKTDRYDGYTDFGGFNVPGATLEQRLKSGSDLAGDISSEFAAEFEKQRQASGDADRLRLGFADLRAAGVEAQTAKKQSFLESSFGTLEEFNGYKMAFDTLSGAVASSLSAWVDGSMSAGEAFKKFVGESVKAIGIQMAMEALKHGAYAIGSLAFGDVRGAATHGKAALMHGAGAAIALGAARALGGSGASAPSAGASPGAPQTNGGAFSAPQQGFSPTIVYGDSYADDSPRNRQRKAKKIVKQALGSNGVSYE
jgi:hypothetical protein